MINARIASQNFQVAQTKYRTTARITLREVYVPFVPPRSLSLISHIEDNVHF